MYKANYSRQLHYFAKIQEAQMKDYDILANQTRDIEQEYTTRILKRYSLEINNLQTKIYHLEQELAHREETAVKQGGLEEKIAQLEMDKNILIEKENQQAIQIKKMQSEFENKTKEIINETKKNPKSTKDVKQLELQNISLQKEIDSLKSALDQSAHAFDGGPIVSEIEKSQNIILGFLKNIDKNNNLKSHFKTFDVSIEGCKESIDKLKNSLANIKTNELSAEIAGLRTLIKDMNFSNRNSNEYYNERAVAKAKEQNDMNVLLKDSIAEKDKIIEKQRDELIKLRKQVSNPFGDGDQLINSQTNSMYPIGEDNSASVEKITNRNPYKSASKQTTPFTEPPVKKTKQAAKGKQASSSKKNGDVVSIADIIKGDNQSFFNNLSFTNSSPMPEKRHRKND